MSGYGRIQRFLRRNTQSDRLYSLLRRALLTAQFVLRRPDERDFNVFRLLPSAPEGGLVVDVGANAGQSAVAFGFTCPSYRILSFEPNPALTRDLAFVRRLLGERFEHRPVALGDVHGEASLLIPHIGDLPVSTRASLSPVAADGHRSRLRAELGRHVELREVRVPVLRLDDLNLRPSVIKVDVEGHELAVLRGARRTIAENRPLLMLEENEESPDCKALLAEYGYAFLKYDTARKALTTNNLTQPTRNWFAVPPDDKLRASLRV